MGHVLQLETVGCTCNISAFRPLICRVLSLPRTAPSRISAVLPRLKRRRVFEVDNYVPRGLSSLCRARKRATWFRSSKRLSSYYRGGTSAATAAAAAAPKSDCTFPSAEINYVARLRYRSRWKAKRRI